MVPAHPKGSHALNARAAGGDVRDFVSREQIERAWLAPQLYTPQSTWGFKGCGIMQRVECIRHMHIAS